MIIESYDLEDGTTAALVRKSQNDFFDMQPEVRIYFSSDSLVGESISRQAFKEMHNLRGRMTMRTSFERGVDRRGVVLQHPSIVSESVAKHYADSFISHLNRILRKKMQEQDREANVNRQRTKKRDARSATTVMRPANR